MFPLGYNSEEVALAMILETKRREKTAKKEGKTAKHFVSPQIQKAFNDL